MLNVIRRSIRKIAIVELAFKSVIAIGIFARILTADSLGTIDYALLSILGIYFVISIIGIYPLTQKDLVEASRS